MAFGWRGHPTIPAMLYDPYDSVRHGAFSPASKNKNPGLNSINPGHPFFIHKTRFEPGFGPRNRGSFNQAGLLTLGSSYSAHLPIPMAEQ
jgi:hypothetical protein